ncbi:LytR/AlgR family response regulator transcription factor [Aquimarina sp. 2201CG14-23]|uniref:LytR/AlgR family response regulator transcription factor n=1 Tax=Aquimarina mycalae TaxID=3040073 RepID=UPI002477E9E4|nr:response regulator transcription factor [Aquimarina sp. 2201CG14-23]MDH7447108.1 response regulator transcription factor [Aquimarina sp. 2201CG14-23]
MKKKINCLIVDDEPLALDLLERHIKHFSQLELIASCWNAIEAFEVLKKESIDLIFLDIQMPGITGIEFVKSLQNPPSIIFTTAYRDYAVESYELDVIDYLLKPITMDRFFKSINKYFDKIEGPQLLQRDIEQIKTTEDSFLYVNTNRKYVKVLFKKVLYVESLKDYVRIHIREQRIVTKDKISEFEKKLPNYFLRVHRSYIINTLEITAFTAHDIEIDGQEIPIGISYKKEVMAFLRKS